MNSIKIFNKTKMVGRNKNGKEIEIKISTKRIWLTKGMK